MARTLIRTCFTMAVGCFVLPNASAQSSKGFLVPRAANDSATVYASSQYESHSFLHRLFMGANYRNEWRQQVKIPVFHFSGSGFRIKDLGGGMQTKSLHLVDDQGKQWGLRTINKEAVDNGLSPALRNRIGRNLSQDLISAAFPYAALLAGELAAAAGLSAARPQIFYVAPDSAFGQYRRFFSGSLCMLEERDPCFDSTISSAALLKYIRAKNSNKVQEEAYLRARLLDMLIADWDRHADNWRWGLRDSTGASFYYAVPRDRDWAFYNSKGLLPWLAQKTGSVPCLVPFTQRLKNIKRQSWKSWEMDKEFTAALDAAAWTKVIASFCASLSNEAIEAAVKVLPASVYASDGEAFAQKLKSRRDAMQDEVMKYYRFLAADVVINGSDEAESFFVRTADGKLKVTVYKTGTQQLLYERIFAADETASITLNGFGGGDVFEIREDVKSRIRFIINGGEGRDSYNTQGDVHCRINDAAAENNEVLYKGKAKLKLK